MPSDLQSRLAYLEQTLYQLSAFFSKIGRSPYKLTDKSRLVSVIGVC